MLGKKDLAKRNDCCEMSGSPAASVKTKAFWERAPRGLAEVDRRFRGTYCLHNEGDLPTRLHGDVFQKTVIFITIIDSRLSYLTPRCVDTSSFRSLMKLLTHRLVCPLNVSA
jgi:hypothetical protein